MKTDPKFVIPPSSTALATTTKDFFRIAFNISVLFNPRVDRSRRGVSVFWAEERRAAQGKSTLPPFTGPSPPCPATRQRRTTSGWVHLTLTDLGSTFCLRPSPWTVKIPLWRLQEGYIYGGTRGWSGTFTAHTIISLHCPHARLDHSTVSRVHQPSTGAVVLMGSRWGGSVG
jgi:hypothetical protein